MYGSQFYSEATLPTIRGKLRCLVYRVHDGSEHVALVHGDVAGQEDVLCRIHSECITGEVFGSLKCDCKAQLDVALDQIAQHKNGILLYLRQEGRGIGLGNKIRAYALQEQGLDTVDANRALGFPDDAREYEAAVDILKHLQVKSVSLMTNNPQKVEGLQSAGIPVSGRVALELNVSPEAKNYIAVKRKRMGHLAS